MADVLMYFFSGEQYGRGHWYRSKTLAQEMVDFGMSVAIASNAYTGLPVKHYTVMFGVEESFRDAIEAEQPKVVVVDVPDFVPDFIDGDGYDVVVIDGVGHDVDGEIVISQGLDGASEYEAPDWLIIDDKFVKPLPVEKPFEWLVFGGYYDKMNLVDAFMRTDMPKSFVVTNNDEVTLGNHAVCKQPVDMRFVASMTRKAVVAMGMIVWELVAMGFKPYVFSLTERHLDTAMRMQERGWVNAYPDIVLPPIDEFVAFLNSGDWRIAARPVDGVGAYRVSELVYKKVKARS